MGIILCFNFYFRDWLCQKLLYYILYALLILLSSLMLSSKFLGLYSLTTDVVAVWRTCCKSLYCSASNRLNRTVFYCIPSGTVFFVCCPCWWFWLHPERKKENHFLRESNFLDLYVSSGFGSIYPRLLVVGWMKDSSKMWLRSYPAMQSWSPFCPGCNFMEKKAALPLY